MAEQVAVSRVLLRGPWDHIVHGGMVDGVIQDDGIVRHAGAVGDSPNGFGRKDAAAWGGGK